MDMVISDEEIIRDEDLECPDEIRQRSRILAEQAEKRSVTTGIHPAGFATACLYRPVARRDDR
jgi:transcription initiation factor TFIIIB Brf1 subunit/transcription initiation factor TFIIB